MALNGCRQLTTEGWLGCGYSRCPPRTPSTKRELAEIAEHNAKMTGCPDEVVVAAYTLDDRIGVGLRLSASQQAKKGHSLDEGMLAFRPAREPGRRC